MYNTNKINSIIFDMDGTVLQSEGLFSIAEQKLLNDYGIIIGVGIDLQVSDEIIMVINLRNNLGLQNISSVPVHNDGKIQNNSLELVFSIGLLDL